jgi:hypothetical protein
MAAIGIAIWKYVMLYAPHTPNYFNRDRFVLSNGAVILHWCHGGGNNAQQALATCSRSHMSLPIYVLAFDGLQGHDTPPTEILSLHQI